MKKFFMLFFFLTLFIPRRTFASTQESAFQLKNDSQYEEIMSLESVAKEALNFVYQENTGQPLPTEITLDLGEALKIYVTDQLLTQDFSQKSLAQELSKSSILWYYEKYLDGTTYLLEITKGSEVDPTIDWSQEELDYLKSIEGKWSISGKGYQEGNGLANKLQQINPQLFTLGNNYLVTGLRLLQTPTLLVADKNQPVALYPLTETIILGEEEVFYGGSTSRSSKENPLVFEKGTYGSEVLDYSLVEKIAERTPVTDEVSGANTLDATLLKKSPQTMPKNIILLGIFLTLGIILIIYRKRKKRMTEN